MGLITALTTAAVVLMVAGGCGLDLDPRAPSPTDVPPSPTSVPTVPPPTATMTPPPSPTPSPTPAPTLDPSTVSGAINAGRDVIASYGVEPICLQQGDADDDGTAEWVGLYMEQGDPPRLRGFVLDGGDWHELRPPTEAEGGMGTHPTCRLVVQDVNGDGRTELMIEGRKAGNVDLLHIFVWGEDAYGLLASFQGDAGVELEDTDGDLIPEILARYQAGSGFAWEAVHTWDGSHYGWTWERYTWLHADRPHVLGADQPRNAVISHYLALDGRNLPDAHRLQSAEPQGGKSYQAWAVGFATTLGIEVGSVREIERAGDAARVTAQVRAYDNERGYAVGRLWDVTWTLVLEEGGWRLQESKADLLDEWEAAYYE